MTEEETTDERTAAQRASAIARYRRACQLPRRLGCWYKILLACILCFVPSVFLWEIELPFLISGLLTVISAIVGLTYGITALWRIRRCPDRLPGNGYVIPSVLMPLFAVLSLISLALAIDIGTDSWVRRYRLHWLRELGDALVEYRSEHGGAMPPADQWCDVLWDTKKDLLNVFYELCGKRFTQYVLNRAATEESDALPEDMVLVFGSDRGWNRAGGPELIGPGADCRIVPVYLVGGEVRLVRRSNVGALRWLADRPGKAAAVPMGGYAAAGAVVAALCGGLMAAFRRYVRRFALAAMAIGVLSALAGALWGWAAEAFMYSLEDAGRLGAIFGGLVGLGAGVCFVPVLGYARGRMRPGVSMVGFATVAGAITGLAASTAVHVFLMIGYNEFYWQFPAAGAGFGIWAGIVLGWVASGLVRNKKPAPAAECAA